MLAWFSAILIAALMFGITWSVVWRYFLNSPQGWTVELAEYSLLFITFLSSAWLLRKNGHVSVELLLIGLSSKTQAFLKILTSALGVLVCFVFVWYGGATALKYFLRNITVIGTLKFPGFILIGVIPVGSLLLLIQFLVDTFRSVEDWKQLTNKTRSI